MERPVICSRSTGSGGTAAAAAVGAVTVQDQLKGEVIGMVALLQRS